MKVSNNQVNINFGGHFQGIIKCSNSSKCYPIAQVFACPYADRMMLKVINRILNKNNKIIIESEKFSNSGVLNFLVEPRVVKKNMPLMLRVFKSSYPNLDDEKFWRILSYPKVSLLKYSFSQEDIDNLLVYFKKPKGATNTLNYIPEDAKIEKKVKRFIENVNKALLVQNSKNIQN